MEKPVRLSKMEKLARDVKILEEQLSLCTRCGMCQANCPLYAETCRESDVSLAKTPFGNPLKEMDFREKGRGVTVAFFVGCLIDKAFPRIALSLVEVLAHFKARVLIPKDQGCCGIPALASGDTKTFEKLLAFHVNLFSTQPIDYLVTACATCSSTIIKQWPALLKGEAGHGELLEKTLLLAEKTVDISWLLAKRFDLSSPFKGKSCPREIITCHDPCHLRKTLGVFDEPRQVIQACGHNLVEMGSPDQCCGMGGSFNLDHYDLSSRIGKEKALDIMATGCSTVATSCPACMMQISDMLARQHAGIRVKHPIEIYAEQLKAVR